MRLVVFLFSAYLRIIAATAIAWLLLGCALTAAVLAAVLIVLKWRNKND